MQVMVPFGKSNQLRKGYVVGFAGHCDFPDINKVKEIDSICPQAQETDSFSYKQQALELAVWMKKRYGSTMSAALKTVLASDRPPKEIRKKEVALLLTREEAEEKLAFYAKKHQVARERLLASLLEVPVQPYELVTQKLHITAPVVRSLKEQGVIEVRESTSLRNPVSVEDANADAKILSAQQQHIVDCVVSDFENNTPSVSLIHGITGSGKTEVYISIIENICKKGRQAIMLIPEISLTYQTLLRFYRHFGDRVSVMNSSLSAGEKADQWERARRGEIDVIIGPRSALFTPFADLGVIVIDEEHENSYKNESMPKYHTKDVAIKIAQMHGACVVLGSATPSVDTYYRALQGQRADGEGEDRYRCHLYTLDRRLTGGTLPEVEVTDMRKELRSGNRSILSRSLAEKLRERLQRKEQTMLFLNRRGFAGFVSCRSCGEALKCPHCDVSLSYHRKGTYMHGQMRARGASAGSLVCHYCGWTEPMPEKCPSCGSPYISAMRAGTEQIEEWLKKQFPGARILRMDADTTSGKGSFEKILSAFANEEADILLGTQMIVKGHDFPKVTLVGILMADLSLYANDYRAAERTFQLLTQAAGRAGRGERPGEVVIQTYQPDHYSIVHASKQDYLGFYEEEISYRRLLGYPPVCHMTAVQIQSKNDDRALALAGEIAELLSEVSTEEAFRGSVIIGPAAASIGRINDVYRYVFYIKCANYDKLISYKDVIETYLDDRRQKNSEGRAGMYADESIQFDFDPVNPY